MTTSKTAGKGKKIRVAVLYGGRSGEHEVSLQSAASVIRNLDPSRFEVVPVGVDREGRWHLNDLSLIEKAQASGKSLPAFRDVSNLVMPPHAGAGTELVPLSGGKTSVSGAAIDVVFPVMHGPLCEDGSVQGLLEQADVPYVGAGVLGSAVGMDKDVAKRLAEQQGIAVVPYVAIRKDAWERNPADCLSKVGKKLDIPVFVKPANTGSSLGVHKVKAAEALRSAIEDAFKYDSKVLVERAISAREIEISALEDPDAPDGVRVSVPGEVVPHHEFYSYEAKYLDENGAQLVIPAKISDPQVRECEEIARRAFVALECEGMARVDLFLDKTDGKIYLNEINTIPGFTTISMYPKLFEASGVPYRELLSRLVDLAITRHARKSKLLRTRE